MAVELARRKAGPDAEKHLNRIEAEGTRMNEMIGQILALARADSENPAVSELFDLSDIVRLVANDTDYEAGQTGRAVHVLNCHQANVRGDSALLASAIENVVRNGCRHTPSGTSVDILLNVTPTHARVVVRDHGPGVPPQDSIVFSCLSIASGCHAIANPEARGLDSPSPHAQPVFTAGRFAPSTQTAAGCR